VQDYIHAGDCYQVNLTQRFECDLADTKSEFSAIDFFLKKQYELQTPYSAFMSFSTDCNLLSFSPEQFIRIKDSVIESKPIKGTIANTADQSNIERLQTSLKNQAENVMIVDLLRNDLSKVCEVNSVHVPELFKIESFKNVHHLVSHIRGTLRNDISALDAFLSCFPGGSITGAPKLRAMEIIRELEMYDRSAYCGSVFYWNDNGHFDSNILIRTVIQTGEKLYCWAGGGIVADSELEDEYQESLTKVANLTGITE
jgi:para-aminobenzoate synthetase component 1